MYKQIINYIYHLIKSSCGVWLFCFQLWVLRDYRPRTRLVPVIPTSRSRWGRPNGGPRPSLATSTRCGTRSSTCECFPFFFFFCLLVVILGKTRDNLFTLYFISKKKRLKSSGKLCFVVLVELHCRDDKRCKLSWKCCAVASIIIHSKRNISEALQFFCVVGFFSHMLSHLCPHQTQNDLLLIPAI